jgi:hypothetical protein
MIRKEVDAALQAKGALAATAQTGREWVRGWDDYKNETKKEEEEEENLKRGD